jgi:DNA-binding NtrC family response regulator
VDALCLDINLPDGNGLDMLEEVRRIDLDLPVIVISGVPTAQIKARAAALGAQMFLEKPFALSELKRILRQCLGLEEIPSR